MTYIRERERKKSVNQVEGYFFGEISSMSNCSIVFGSSYGCVGAPLLVICSSSRGQLEERKIVKKETLVLQD